MVRMVWTAEVSLAFFLTLSICGTARAIRMSMMDMTMRSSMRVKPASGSRFAVRGSRCGDVQDLMFMSCGYLNRLTALEYRRFGLGDGVGECGERQERITEDTEERRGH